MPRLSARLLLACVLALCHAAHAMSGSAIRQQAKSIRPGRYVIRPASDPHRGLTYTHHRTRDLTPQGRGSAITIFDAGHRTSGLGVEISQRSTRNGQCLSAQWTGDADENGVLYECTVGPHARHWDLRPAKQQYHFVPASKSSGLYHICTEDHLDDQPPRCLGDQRIKSTDDEYGTALVVYKAGDKRQLWSLHRV